MLKDLPCFVGWCQGELVLKAAVDALIGQALADKTLNGLSEKWLNGAAAARRFWRTTERRMTYR